MSEVPFKLGYHVSPSDHRDYIYGAIVGLNEDKIATLPSSFSLPRIPENLIVNQVIGDCVGQSSRYIKIFQEYQSSGQWYDFNADFVYSICKTLDGSPDVEGTYPKYAQSVLNKYGICHRDKYVDLVSNDNRPTPSQDAYNDAKPFVTKSYAKVSTLDEIKHALVEQGAVQIGLIATDSFMNPEDGGFVGLPLGNIVGGHAICITGFDDNMTHTYKDGTTRNGFLQFVNSWGLNYGQKGYGYMPYDFLTYRTDIGMSFFMEAWASCDLSDSPNVQPTPIPQPTTKVANQIKVKINDINAYVDGVKETLDQPPILTDKNRAMIPIRFFGENVGYEVDYNEQTQEITLTRK